MKLCDVFPDGTSALVARGTLDLAFRDGVHGAAAPLVPGRDRTTSRSSSTPAPTPGTPGNRLRVCVAGADWPNTIAPPAPVTLTVRRRRSSSRCSPATTRRPTFTPGAAHSSESAEGVGWEIRSDVLAAHHHGA